MTDQLHAVIGSTVPDPRPVARPGIDGATIRSLLPWIAAALCVLFVARGSNYVITVGTVTVIWAMLAVALNSLMGYSGLINLGLGAFYAIGAYGAAISQIEHGWSPWLGLAVFPPVAALIAAIIGPALLRTRGLHFAVATLGIGIIVSDVLGHWVSVTKGPIGIPGITRPGTIHLGIVDIDPSTETGFFVLATLILGVVLVIASLYHRSRVARVLVASRDDELLTTSLGFQVTRYKVLGFALSAGLAAVAGVIYAWFIRYISPDSFSFFAASFPTFVLVAVGGPGRVWGPVVGAAFLTGFPEWMDVQGNTKNIIYGAVLLVVIVVLPDGVAPTLARLGGRLVRRLLPARFTRQAVGS